VVKLRAFALTKNRGERVDRIRVEKIPIDNLSGNSVRTFSKVKPQKNFGKHKREANASISGKERKKRLERGTFSNFLLGEGRGKKILRKMSAEDYVRKKQTRVRELLPVCQGEPEGWRHFSGNS